MDLSSNKFTEFPLCVKDAPKLKVLRLIYNQIRTIPTEYYKAENVKENLEELNMNSNPLIELHSSIKMVSKLKVLGISYTKIKEIPRTIIDLEHLKQISCYGTPLKEPKSTIA